VTRSWTGALDLLTLFHFFRLHPFSAEELGMVMQFLRSNKLGFLSATQFVLFARVVRRARRLNSLRFIGKEQSQQPKPSPLKKRTCSEEMFSITLRTLLKCESSSTKSSSGNARTTQFHLKKAGFTLSTIVIVGPPIDGEYERKKRRSLKVVNHIKSGFTNAYNRLWPGDISLQTARTGNILRKVRTTSVSLSKAASKEELRSGFWSPKNGGFHNWNWLWFSNQKVGGCGPRNWIRISNWTGYRSRTEASAFWKKVNKHWVPLSRLCFPSGLS